MTTKVPDRFCDLVMKGGITSGVVYPLAAVKLAQVFRFRNIGGTSAGAIAAAATAGAELARDRGGFDTLAKLPQYLGEVDPSTGGTNLLGFFQPQPATSRLFRLGLASLGGGWAAIGRVTIRLLRSYPLPLLGGAIPGIAFAGWAASRAQGGFLAACMLVAAGVVLAGISASLILALLRDLRALQGNFYGLCTGMTAAHRDLPAGATPPAPRPLTFWLHEYLNAFAGRSAVEAPLTFGELWGTRDPLADRRINLEMMTTCLTHGRPYRLPFRNNDDVRENSMFYFRRDEFEQLFPKVIVDWMVAHPRALERANGAEKRAALAARGYFPLPEPADLPVVVATRMSLSFPILLSAVPLHAVDRTRDPDGLQPERCWFSDGGVCSNFPIHFFDSPLPRWPTLTINLVDQPAGTPASALAQPEMPSSNSDGIQEHWNRFDVTEWIESGQIRSTPKGALGSMVSFLYAFVTTMQNWSDNVQSRLPGYRDRIANVGLNPEEGGLNLNMPTDRIKALTERGAAAADEFIRRFAVPSADPKMNWDNHRWLRMRSCLASIEVLLGRIDRTCANPQPGDAAYEQWIATIGMSGSPCYPWSSQKQQEAGLMALQSLRRVTTAIADCGAKLETNAPRPRPELRPRAQV